MNNKEIQNLITSFIKEHNELLSLPPEKKVYFIENLKSALIKNEDSSSINKIKEEYINKLKPEYQNASNHVLQEFLQYLSDKVRPPLQVTENDIKNFIKNDYKNGKTKSFVRVRFSRVNQFYKYLEEEKYILHEQNPFNKVKLSDVEYKTAIQNNLPTEKDILVIIDSLSLELKVFLALIAVKGYSLNDFYDVSFNSTSLELIKENKYITVTYSYTQKDIWENVPKEDNIDFHNIISNDFFQPKNYYEYLSTPKWYNDILNQFWNEFIKDHYFFDKDWGKCSINQLYYRTEQINLEACEREVLKTVNQLYKNGKIPYPYKMKDFRIYSVCTLYNQTHDLARVQKFLGHTNPNTTRRYLQNIGIKL